MSKLLLSVALLIAVVSRGPTQNAVVQADLVLFDGKILTVDDRFREATALAVRDGRFIAVGSNQDVRRYIGSTTRVIDGRGRTVVPGLIDTHVHALDVAEAEAALAFLEAKKKQRGSQVVIDLIVRAALRNGWRPPPLEGESTTRL